MEASAPSSSERLDRLNPVERELLVATPYRQVDADRAGFEEDSDEILGLAQRAEIERESRAYADSLGYSVDWDSVGRLDDELATRADLLVQFMQFQRMAPGGADGPETLQ